MIVLSDIRYFVASDSNHGTMDTMQRREPLHNGCALTYQG